MQSFRDLSIRAKLLITLLGISLLSIGIVGWTGYSNARDSLKAEAFSKLSSVRSNKATAVESYFGRIRSQIRTVSSNDQTVRAMRDFRAAFRELKSRSVGPSAEGNTALRTYYEDEFVPRLKEGRGDSGPAKSYLPKPPPVRYLQHQYISGNPNPVGEKDNLLRAKGSWHPYHEAHADYHDDFRRLLDQFNYYDIFLVEPEGGHIVYSVFKEVDFATSLLDGPYRKSNFAEAFREVRDAQSADATRLVDFAEYAPSYSAPASFIASPVMDEGEVVGVLVFQMPIGEINRTLTGGQNWKKNGLGKTGETFLVGGDGRMRSDARLLAEDKEAYLDVLRKQGHSEQSLRKIEAQGTSILHQEARTAATEKALAGKTGQTMETDYRGESVLSTYAPIDIAGVNWGIVSKIDRAEAFSPIQALTWDILLWSGGLLILVSVVALAFVRSFTRPLLALRDASKKVATGDLDVSVPVNSRDEIGRLTAVFNEMVEETREALQEAQAQEQEAQEAHEEASRLAETFQEINDFLSSEIEDLSDRIDRLARGDLTVSFIGEGTGSPSQETDDAARMTGQLRAKLEEAVQSVHDTLRDVASATEETASAASQISASSDQMAASVEEQSTQAEEVAAAVEELNQTISENAKSVQRTAEAAEAGGEQARRGGEIVTETTQKMEQIADVVDDTATTIERLGVSTEEIGKVVDRIDEIAEQTNLLALNAAIEAARAGGEGSGRTGQGFAVVAEEVRELAEEADAATDEIEEMIEEVQRETDKAVDAARQSRQRAEEGLELADQVGETIGEVVSSIEEVEERTDEIAAASEEQSTTSEEIARSVQSISTAAQESAAGVTEVSGAADDLERVTERLRKGVDAFVLEDGGTDHRSSGRATSHRPESRSSHSGDSPEERPMKGGNGRAASHVS